MRQDMDNLVGNRISYLLVVLFSSGIGACGAGPDASAAPEDLGSVEIALKKVPPAVHCLQIVATGSRVLTTSFDVVPGAATSLTMPGLSPGSVTFTGAAFAGLC